MANTLTETNEEDLDGNGPEFWDARYEGEDYFFGLAPNAYLEELAHLLEPGMRVLLPAEGEGRNGVWLAERGLRVTAVDVSPRALEKARALAAERGAEINFVEADLRTYDWPKAEFDLVAAIFIHFHSEHRARIHAGMLGALKPGGHLIMEGFTPEQLNYSSGGPPDADKLYTPAMLQDDFADAEILHLEEQVRVLGEGFLDGPGAVFRLLARRP